MQFWITISHDRESYRYPVTHSIINTSFEHFTIMGGNGTMVIQSNRPLFRSKGIMKRKPDLKVLKGPLWNRTFQGQIFEELWRWMGEAEGN